MLGAVGEEGVRKGREHFQAGISELVRPSPLFHSTLLAQVNSKKSVQHCGDARNPALTPLTRKRPIYTHLHNIHSVHTFQHGTINSMES